MSETKIIIAGGGIAGMVLAMLLKLKGYAPTIYERNEGPSTMGLGLCLQPNGLRVLALIPGLLEEITRGHVVQSVSYSMLPDDKGELARADISLLRGLTGGFGVEGVRRKHLLDVLSASVHARGVPIVYGHQLVNIEQHTNSVITTFANGTTAEGSFLIGCDGLHSNTRTCLFGKEQAMYTGLTQTGGISPMPSFFKEHRLYPLMNAYGDGVHFIAYAVNEEQISWAISLRESEQKETWRAMDQAKQEEFKAGPFSKMPFGVGELVTTADNIIKYGLYDRPALSSWHRERVVLIGDAAHPTSVHLGQGANQAIEDVYHLVRLLAQHNPSAAPPSTDTLETVFTALEEIRIPRTSALVQKARAQGEVRVASGAEACKRRNESVRETFRLPDGAGPEEQREVLRALFKDYLEFPFSPGKSEI